MEEIQSSNEELATVNEELQTRNAELGQSNNDLMNLLASVQMAIVMVWPDLRIRRFTPVAEKLFNLIRADVGRPIGDIQLNLNIDNFKAQGIEIPKTYDGFVAACDKLKKAGILPIAAGGANGSGWALEINAGVVVPTIFGAGFFDEMMKGTATFKDPRYVKTLERIKAAAEADTGFGT